MVVLETPVYAREKQHDSQVKRQGLGLRCMFLDVRFDYIAARYRHLGMIGATGDASISRGLPLEKLRVDRVKPRLPFDGHTPCQTWLARRFSTL